MNSNPEHATNRFLATNFAQHEEIQEMAKCKGLDDYRSRYTVKEDKPEYNLSGDLMHKIRTLLKKNNSFNTEAILMNNFKKEVEAEMRANDCEHLGAPSFLRQLINSIKGAR